MNNDVWNNGKWLMWTIWHSTIKLSMHKNRSDWEKKEKTWHVSLQLLLSANTCKSKSVKIAKASSHDD